MDIIKQMNWRYAVKKFDEKKALTEEQTATILESVRLSGFSPTGSSWLRNLKSARLRGNTPWGTVKK